MKTKNTICFIFACMFLFSLASVSAMVGGGTVISGIVFSEEDLTQGVNGADVTVICNHSGNLIYRYTSSGISPGMEGGYYSVEYPSYGDDEVCDWGDEVTVIAVKGDLSGTATGNVDGVIGESLYANINVIMTKIPVIPEFGLIVGLLTLVSSIGIFFFVRRD